VITVSASTASNYEWNNGSVSQNISVSDSGSFQVRTQANGCYSEWSDVLNVHVQAIALPIITATSNLCEDNQIVLRSSASYAYHWSTGATSDTIIVTTPGEYWLVHYDSEGHISDTATYYVNRYSNPVVLGTATNVNCYGESNGMIHLDVSAGSGLYEYDWSTGATDSANLISLSMGRYWVTVTDMSFGCRTIDTIDVYQPEQLMVTGTVMQPYCEELSTGGITLNISGGVSPYLTTWSNESQETALENIGIGIYSVTIEDFNGCTLSTSFTVSALNEYCIKVATVMTPNDDGKNDYWYIDGIENYEHVTITIFDRWNSMIYTFDGSGETYVTNPWDGYSKGKLLPLSAYRFVIDLHNGQRPMVGVLTLVH